MLEFLGHEERSEWRERDLEQAIIDRLEHFLLELGRGFCFVARQKRITLEGDHFYVDLVFYNRLLRCFVILDLNLDLAPTPPTPERRGGEARSKRRYRTW